MFKVGKEQEVVGESREKNSQNPSERSMVLCRTELENEFKNLKDAINNNDYPEIYLKRIELLTREMAIYQEFGKKAEVEMRKNATKEELSESKIADTFKSFSIKNFLDSKFDSLKSKFAQRIKPIKYAALALMFSLQPMVSQSQNKGETKGLEKNKLEDTRTSNINKNTEDPNRTYNLGANFRFSEVNENGEKKFNILSVIAPVELELDVNKTVEGNMEVNIPLTYASDFESTGLTNEEDSLKMAKYFENQIREVIANTLINIGGTGVYNANHEGQDNLLKEAFSKLKITSINITGYASPEATGANSVIPGNKEEDNAKPAKKRAEIVKGVVEKILKENKVDSSVLDSVNFEEVQFSDSEWNSLTGLADSLGIKGSAPEDQIIELISRYNNGEYNDNASVKKTMDDIVGSKRGATIEIEYETNKKTQVIVPIPLLLLLLLSRRIRRGINPFNWKKDNDKFEENTKKGEDISKTPKELFSEKNINEEDVANKEFNYYKLYETADKGINYQDQYLVRKIFLRDMLSVNIDDEVSLDHGLDYRDLIDHIASVRDRYNTEEELNIEIAGALLGMWEQYDRSIRKEAGIEIDEKTTLDYRHDEKKILWAKIAAPEILKLAHKYNNPEDLRIEIQKIIEDLEEKVENAKEKDMGVFEIKPIGEKGNGLNKGTEIGTSSTTILMDAKEKIENQKEVNGISQEEYDGMRDDLKMINKKIQSSEGIATLEESDFRSEYGKKRYNELKHIQGGDKPITFNKEELEIIGKEMEGMLSSATVIKKEVIETVEEKEELGISQEEYDGMRDDLKMINKKIQSSEGIATLEESDFRSEYGKKRYNELKHIQGGDKPITFNKEELEIIGKEMEGMLSSATVIKKEVINKKESGLTDEQNKSIMDLLNKSDKNTKETELEMAKREEQSIFAEFKKFTEEHPTEKIPTEMEDRYRKAEEKLKLVKENSEKNQIKKTKGDIEKSFDDTTNKNKVNINNFGEITRYKIEDLSKIGTEFKNANGSFVVTKILDKGLYGLLNKVKIEGIYKDNKGVETRISYNKKDLEKELENGSIEITKVKEGK